MRIGRLFSCAAGRFSTAAATLCCTALLQACGGGGGDSGGAPDDGGQPPAVAKGSVSLLAGAIGGAGNLDGAGAAARFDGPSGLALGPDGDLYVADLRNQRIRRVTRAGVVSTVAGSGAAGNADGAAPSATFCFPRDVAVDAAGRVFVATEAAVRKIAPDGMVTTVAGAGTARCGVFDQNTDRREPPATPEAVAVDMLGIVYIADSFAGAVYTLTPAGTLTRLAGGDDPANPASGLGLPTGIALDAMRNVYVADGSSRSIVKIAPTGQPTTLVPPSATLGYPSAIAADAVGNLYVTDSEQHVVRRVTPAGAVSVIAGAVNDPGSIDGPRGTARLDSPHGVALAADGTLFVSEWADTIRSIDLATGDVRTLAGLATPRAPNFGAYHAIDGAGNVYVAQQVAAYPGQDHAIRRIAPDGTQTTLVAGGLKAPRGMALDAAGNLYVVDVPEPDRSPCFSCGVNTVVYKITPQGGMTLLAGTLTPSGIGNVDGTGSAAVLRSAFGIAADAAGNLYVSQAGGTTTSLRRITPDGTVSTLPVTLPGDALFPSDVVVDAAGNLYLGLCPISLRSDQPPPGAALLKVDPRGLVTVLAGSLTEPGFEDASGAQARFGGCLSGLALDAAGNVYAADRNNDAVRKITPDGVVSTIVGRPGVRGITLGSLPASLSAPTDASVDAAGNLYVGSAHALLKVRFDGK